MQGVGDTMGTSIDTQPDRAVPGAHANTIRVQPETRSASDLVMLFGFALFQTWVTLCFFTPQLFPSTADDNHVYEISLVVSVVILIAGALGHRRLEPVLQRRLPLWILALGAAIGTALVPLCFGSEPLSIVLTVIAGILTGTASGLFNVAWCLAFVRRGSAISFALSVVTSSIIIYILTNIAYSPSVSPYVMLGISIAIPLVSVFLLCYRGQATVMRASMSIPISLKVRRHNRFLIQLCAGIFVISLTDEFLRNYYLEGTDLSFYSSQINLIILLFKILVSVFVVFAIRRMRYEDFSFLYRASFMLALISALLLPFASSTGSVGYAIANCGAFLFKLTVLLVSLEFCAQGAPAVRTFCIIRAVWSLDLLLGYALYELNSVIFSPGLDPGILTIIFVILIAFAYLFVFSPDREYSLPPLREIADPEKDAWADADRPADTMVGSHADEYFVELDAVCEQLAQEVGLSPRESDVLHLLARGRTTTRIQNELDISMNTVNTHVRHVFQKLDIHSRQELLDLIEKSRK